MYLFSLSFTLHSLSFSSTQMSLHAASWICICEKDHRKMLPSMQATTTNLEELATVMKQLRVDNGWIQSILGRKTSTATKPMFVDLNRFSLGKLLF